MIGIAVGVLVVCLKERGSECCLSCAQKQDRFSSVLPIGHLGICRNSKREASLEFPSGNNYDKQICPLKRLVAKGMDWHNRKMRIRVVKPIFSIGNVQLLKVSKTNYCTLLQWNSVVYEIECGVVCLNMLGYLIVNNA